MRPIVVMSHIMKVLERTMLNKLKAADSKLFQTGAYQAGLK